MHNAIWLKLCYAESRIQVLDNSEVLVELKRLHVPALFQNYQIKSKEDHQLERKNSTEELQPDIDLLNQDVKKGDFVPQEAPEINMESFSKASFMLFSSRSFWLQQVTVCSNQHSALSFFVCELDRRKLKKSNEMFLMLDSSALN